MAAKTTNQLRQAFKVRQGVIDIKLVTTRGLAGDTIANCADLGSAFASHVGTKACCFAR